MTIEQKSIAVIPRTMPEIQSMAEVLAKSNLLPDALRNKVPDVVVQIMAGAELGLPPMAAIRGVHIVAGKPILSADTMIALVRASGSCEYFMVENETDTSVTYVCKRAGDPKEQRYTWSDEDTKLACLNTKDNWRLFKKQMRRARCKAILARDVWPDVLAAVYEFDSNEIEIPRPEYQAPAQRFDTSDAVDVEVIDGNSADSREYNARAAIDNAVSIEEMKSYVVKAIAEMKLPKSSLERVNAAYKARIQALREAESAPVVLNVPAPAEASV